MSASLTRTWILHVLACGMLALACVAACAAAWPVDAEPSRTAPVELVGASLLFVLHAVVTTWLLSRHRVVAYALHVTVLGFVLLA